MNLINYWLNRLEPLVNSIKKKGVVKPFKKWGFFHAGRIGKEFKVNFHGSSCAIIVNNQNKNELLGYLDKK